MCRNIRNLFNFETPATEEEIQDAALQFVRKLSGFNTPSVTNQEVFNKAVNQVVIAANQLLQNLITTAPPKNRQEEYLKAKERNAKRFGNTNLVIL